MHMVPFDKTVFTAPLVLILRANYPNVYKFWKVYYERKLFRMSAYDRWHII